MSASSLSPHHRPRKRFGQNFLHDQTVIDRIIASLSPLATDTIVEIGPGLGALTKQLIASTGSIHAIEIDRDLAAMLRQEFSEQQLSLITEDALKYDFSSLSDKRRSLRIVGNLPYNISTPLIFHLLKTAPIIIDMHFMLQQEVVDRLAAPPGNKTYGRLSVMAQFYTKVEKLFTVPPGAFNPPPKVYSAVVRMTPHSQQLDVGSVSHFERLVAQAFSQRRKTLRNTLKGLVSDDVFSAAKVDPSRRCETLCLEEFSLLSQLSFKESTDDK